MSPAAVELPGWTEFHARRSGLRPQRYSEADGGARLTAILYLDGRGRVHLPYLVPYLPISFETDRQRPSGRTAEWLRLAAPLADEMRRRTVPHRVFLSPTVTDVRPWRWNGFIVDVDYAYTLDLPFDPARMDRGHRRAGERAAALGMRVERTDDPAPIVSCLAQSAERVGYELRIDESALRMAQGLIGTDGLRMYACIDPGGAPASACVVVHAAGSDAFVWLSGTDSGRRHDGSTHLLWRTVIEDIEAAGATGVDFGGPNSPSISDFKARWGSRLVPMYSVRSYGLRAAARFCVSWLRPARRSPTEQQTGAASRAATGVGRTG